MKTITDDNSILLTYVVPNVVFGVIDQGTLTFKSITIQLQTDADFKVRGVLEPDEWIKTMLSNKVYYPVDFDVTGLSDFMQLIAVEDASVDGILTTLLRVLRNLNPEITIKSISYAEQS